MRRFRRFGSALVLAVFVATGMVTFSARLQAAGPGGGRSQTVLCGLLARAISSATALFGADSALVVYLQGEFNANCQ